MQCDRRNARAVVGARRVLAGEEGALRRRLPPGQGGELPPRRDPAAHRAPRPTTCSASTARSTRRARRKSSSSEISSTAHEGRAPRTLARFAQWREARRNVALTSCAATTTRRPAILPKSGTCAASRRASGSAPSSSTTSPVPARGGYALAGHIHPAVRLSGARRKLRAPAVLLVRRALRRAAGLRRLHRQRRACGRGAATRSS